MKKDRKDKLIRNINEALFVIGFVMLGVGIYMIYHPAMYIVCGGLMVYAFMPKGGVSRGADK